MNKKFLILLLSVLLCSCSTSKAEAGPFVYEKPKYLELSLTEDFENMDYIGVKKPYLLFDEERNVGIILGEVETDDSLEDRTVQTKKWYISIHRVPTSVVDKKDVAIIKVVPSEKDTDIPFYYHAIYEKQGKKYIALAEYPDDLSDIYQKEILSLLKSIDLKEN